MKSRSNPFVRISGAFAIGILAQPSFSILIFLLPLALAATAIFYWLSQKRAALAVECCFAASVLAAVAAFGGLAGHLAAVRPANAVELAMGQQVDLSVTVLEDARESRFGSRAMVACTGTHAGNLMAYFPADAPLVQMGMQLRMQAAVQPLPEMEGYASWLRHQGVYATASCREVVVVGMGGGWRARGQALRRKLLGRIRACMPEARMAGLACAMLLGDKGGLDREVKADFGRAGLSHVLAISGLHVGIVFAFLSKLLAFLAVSPKGARLRTFLILLLMVAYAVLTGGSPAVCRAVLMLSLLEIGNTFFLQRNSLNLLAVSGFLLLLMDPQLIFQAGFQLSYAAVAGILVLGPRLRRRLEAACPACKGYLAGAISVCLTAQAFTAPLVWLHFGQFPTYFLLSNLALLPLISLAVMLGFTGLLTVWIPGMGKLIFGMMDFVLAIISAVSRWIGGLPGAIVEEISLHSTAFLLLCGMCMLGLGFLYWRELAAICTRKQPPAFPQLRDLRPSPLRLRQAAGWGVAAMALLLAIYLG